MTPSLYWTIIVGLVSASFVWWRILSGHYVTNLSLDIKLDRQPKNEAENDILIVSITLKKGEFSTLALERLRIRGDADGEELFDTAIDAIHIDENRSLNLAPGEQTQFARAFEIPRHVTCEVKVAVDGRRWQVPGIERVRTFARRNHIPFVEGICKRGSSAHWRATAVTAPLLKATQPGTGSV